MGLLLIGMFSIQLTSGREFRGLTEPIYHDYEEREELCVRRGTGPISIRAADRPQVNSPKVCHATIEIRSLTRTLMIQKDMIFSNFPHTRCIHRTQNPAAEPLRAPPFTVARAAMQRKMSLSA
jgi:hypothetical protein